MCYCIYGILVLQISYVKTDFNNWKDEDDSEDEADQVNQNFEDVCIMYNYQHETLHC